MKKILVLIFIGSINAFAFAQFTSVTPKVGMTFSNMKDYNERYKIGYLVGASTEYKLSSKVVIKPELLLEQKGGSDIVTLTDEIGWPIGDYKWYSTFNYLILPLQVKYIPFISSKIYFSAGGYAGYLLWASNRIYGGKGDAFNARNKLDTKEFNKWNVGFSAGSGIDIPLNERSGIQVELRYEYAFWTDDSKLPPSMNTFSLSVGYTFKIAK